MAPQKFPSQPARRRSFVYSDFEHAKERILKSISAGPFYGLLTGSSGTGKTSLLREIAAVVDRHRCQVHYLAQSQASSVGVGRFLAETLRLSARRTHTQTLRALADTLKAVPFRVLLFIDEAHCLVPDALQEIRLLAESEIDSLPLFSVLFAGLPELKAKLDAPQLFPLKRRLLFRLELNGLKADEVAGFFALRLGDLAARFPSAAVPQFFERAGGVPALLESLAKACLEASPGTGPIPMDNIQETLESWDLS
jgi:general secretion pathway protein A